MQLTATLEERVDCDRRRVARQDLAIDARLRAPDQTLIPVSLIDFSNQGCGLLTSHPLEVGARFFIDISGFRWPCTVVWSEEQRAGLSFDLPMHRGLLDWLTDGRSWELREYVANLLARFAAADQMRG